MLHGKSAKELINTEPAAINSLPPPAFTQLATV